MFHTFLYVPIYNLLIFLVDIVPGGDVGLAVVLATIIVKLILMPLSLSAVKTQRRMKLIEKDLKALRETHKGDKERQAKEMLALYRENGIRPFSSILGILIQLPIIITLYLVFSHESLLTVNTALVYPFVPIPETIAPLFLGIFTVAGHSIILALAAAAAQFAHAYVSIPVPAKTKDGPAPSAAEDFGRIMALQARFVLPLIIGVVAYTSGGIALYFITSSIVGLVQEWIVRKMKHPAPPPAKAM